LKVAKFGGKVIQIRVNEMSYNGRKNYFALGYNTGAIVRVRVKNFLTYDECEVFPGPKLNVVIGPNGSGKSTLTHAICLACCGSTGDIGKL
jgi:energy-coupling factor transporter ATP-binding protein EcfA2